MLAYLLTDQGFTSLVEARGLVAVVNSPDSSAQVAAAAWVQLGKVAARIQSAATAHNTHAAEAMGRNK